MLHHSIVPMGKAERERERERSGEGGKKRNFVSRVEGERARAKLFSHKSGYGDLRSANRIRGNSHCAEIDQGGREEGRRVDALQFGKCLGAFAGL